MDKETKSKLIKVSPVIILALLLVGYLAFEGSGNKKKEPEKSEENSAFVDPGVDTANGEVTKMGAYDQMMKKIEQEENMQKKRKTDDFYGGFMSEGDSAEKEKEKKVEKEKSDDYYANLTKKKEEPKPKPKPVKKKKPEKKVEEKPEKDSIQDTMSEIEKRKQQYEKNGRKEKKDEILNVYNGLGVVVDKEKKQTTKQPANLKDASEYVQASLVYDYHIKDGSQVTFYLDQPSVIDGIKFNKTAEMYGVAEFTNGRVLIHVNTIRNTDGQKYSVNLHAYNENYQQGIPYDGKMEESVNRSSNNALSSTTSNISIDAAKDVARGVVRGLKKDPEIKIKEGYQMYFK